MKQFTVDWKFRVEDIVWNIKQIVSNFPVKYFEERQEFGDFYEIVKVDDREYKFKLDTSYENLEEIMKFMNKYLPNKKKQFVIVSPGDDDYTFRLENK